VPNPMPDDPTTYDPESRTQNTSKRECQHCGHYGYEHDKERVNRDGDRYGYDLLCPTEGN